MTSNGKKNGLIDPYLRLQAFLNYGIVDEENPHDKMVIQVTIPQADPLFQLKRRLLQKHNLATQQTFQLQRNQVLLPSPPLSAVSRACLSCGTKMELGQGNDLPSIGEFFKGKEVKAIVGA